VFAALVLGAGIAAGRASRDAGGDLVPAQDYEKGAGI
jgi:hypothetical protein